MKNNESITEKKSGSLSHDFSHYVEHHTELSQEDQKDVTELFAQDHIKKTVRVSLILFVWAFFATFLDSVLFGSAVFTSVVGTPSVLNFLPSIFFLVINMLAKLAFMKWFDSQKSFTRAQHFLASVPTFGVILFLSAILKEEKLFLKTLRAYLKYARKRGARFILNLLNRNVSY